MEKKGEGRKRKKSQAKKLTIKTKASPGTDYCFGENHRKPEIRT